MKKTVFLLTAMFLAFRMLGDVAVHTSGLSLRLDSKGQGLFKNTYSGDESKVPLDMLTILDGKNDHQKLILNAVKVTQQGAGAVIQYKTQNSALTIEQVFEKRDGFILSRIMVKNEGTQAAFLKLRQSLPLLPGKESLNYWNGNALRENIKLDLTRDEIFNSLPMACIYTRKSGIAAGIEPNQIFNFIETGIIFSEKPESFYFGVKLVVDAGQTNQAEFILYSFEPDYGYLNAVADYQNFSPELFQPHENIDKRIYSGALTNNLFYYNRLGGRKGISREFARRQGATWVWGYAPFQVPGDWYGRKNVTEDPKLHAMEEVEYGTYETFQKNRRIAIDEHAGQNLAYLFYITSWCDRNLAEHFYKDGVITDKRTRNLIGPTWVLRGSYDYRMWMWNNKFGEDTKNDIKRIASEMDIKGIAFDCASGPGVARGTGVETMEGRAYDEEGIYAYEGAATAKILDFVHNLKGLDGKNLGVSVNLAGNKILYFVALRSDNALTDWSLSEAINNAKGEEIQRFLLGTRPQNWFSYLDKEKYGNSLPWQDFSPEKILEIYNGIRDNLILFSLRFAYFPGGNENWGNVKIMKYMPILRKVFSAGYQVVPAMRLNSDLWHARYGSGLDTILFIGNQKFREQKLSVSVDNKYLGKGGFLFQKYSGESVPNKITAGNTTVTYSLKSKEPLLLLPVLEIKDIGANQLEGTASRSADHSGGALEIALKANAPFTSELLFRMPADQKAASLEINGREVEFEEASDTTLCCKASLATDNSMKLTWKSRIFHVPETELLAYEFIGENNTPVCAIVTDDKPDPKDSHAASMLQEYFRFYYEHARNQSGVLIPIKTKNEVKSLKNCVIIAHNSTLSTGISLDKLNHNLLISDENAESRRHLVGKLLTVLDIKYPYYGKIGENASYIADPATQKMRDKGGIGKGAVWQD